MSARMQFGRTAMAAMMALCAAIATGSPSAAETKEIRISQQFGLTWLALHVMIDQKMIERRASELGLDGVKVTLLKLSGGPAANEALLSGNVDIAGSGGPPAMILTDKTRGRQNVRWMGFGRECAPSRSGSTTDPKTNQLADLGPNGPDRAAGAARLDQRHDPPDGRRRHAGRRRRLATGIKSRSACRIPTMRRSR